LQYSSRDDLSSSTARYSSSALTSPSSYRPSFSGGTYRLKRDTPSITSSSASTYVSRYTPSTSSVTSSTTLARADSSTSDMKSVSQLKRYGSTSSSIGKYSREPSPAALEHTNRMRSRDPSPGIRSLRGQSRDPSPGMDSKYKYGSSYRMNMPKAGTTATTPTSSAYSSRYGATRTPSSTSLAEKTPTARTASSTSLADKNKSYTSRTPSTTSLAEKSLSYGTVSTRRTPSCTSLADKPISYGTRQPAAAASTSSSYGLSSRTPPSSSIKPALEEKPLASEGRPRNASNQSPISYYPRDYHTPVPQQIPVSETSESPKESTNNAPPIESESKETKEKEKNEEEEDDQEDSDTTEESDTSEDEEILPQPPKEQFLSITVCTRGTSPNPPGSQVSDRSTHSLAITIEKTILRSSSKRKMLEKEMQSEECTKVSRLAYGSRLSPYNSAAERRSPSNLRYSSSPISSTSKSNSLSIATTTTATTKSKLSPPRVGRLKSRQSSVESLSPKKPPLGPKAESPYKSPSPSSLSPAPSRLPNKDFRKSSLNVGPTDRTRKSRTPSTGTDSDFNTIDALNGALQAIQRLERSPSACSEISIASNRSARLRTIASENKLRPRALNKPLGSRTPPSPLSRQNSNSSIKPAKSPLPASPLAMRSNKILVTAATSSSSGTESSAAEVKKPHKKMVKKKVVKEAPPGSSSTTATTTSLSSSSANNSDNQSSAATSSLSKRSLPQPKAMAGTQTTAAAAKKTESSPLKKSASTSSRTDKDPLRRLKKLSSVSNFFVAQQKNAENSDDQIYLESTETSGGGGSGGGTATSTDLDVGSTKSSKKSISLLRANETKTSKSTTPATSANDNNTSRSASNRSSPAVQYTRENSASEQRSTHNSNSKSKSSATKSSVTSKSKTKSKSSASSTSITSSSSGTDSEEPSWWQDTSQQIDTSSALDCSFKDEMRFKVRHVDSGETAWWFRNDDEATLADDLATLNQDEEDNGENDEATVDIYNEQGTKAQAAGWWETTDDNNANEYQNDANISFSDLDYKTKTYYNDQQEITDSESRPFPRSRLTPETDWWNDEDDAPQAPIQNGTIQLKICRVESAEAPWWQQDDENNQAPQEEQKPSVEPETSTSSSSSMSTEPKKWWMTGPSKKLFNIPRVESGEKAWWQNENSDKESQQSKNSQSKEQVDVVDSMAPQNSTIKKLFNLPRVESGEKAWWLDENSEDREEHSNSQNQEQHNSQKSDNITSHTPSASPPQNPHHKKLFNIPRVESGEKAWWLEDSPEKSKTRSNSKDSEGLRENRSPTKQDMERQRSPNKKLFNISRLDSDQEEEPWWQQDTHERGKTRSRSREPEQEFRNRNRPDSRQPGTPTKEQSPIWSTCRRTSQSPVKQIFSHPEVGAAGEVLEEDAEVCPPAVVHYAETPPKRVLTQQQSLEEQKERWLQERQRQYQQQQHHQSNEDIYQHSSAGLDEHPNYPHSYQLTTDDDDHQSTFLPQNRVDSQTELSNSFNFEYSERPPPLGQCASPVYCSSPYDNIPTTMTKVQQTPANNNTAVDAMNLMPISGASPPPPLPVGNNQTAFIPENNKINVNAAAYQQDQPAMPQTPSYHEQPQPSVYQRQTPPSQHRNQNDLRSKNEKAFISRHQNIDELLSGACRALSPIFFDNDGGYQTMPTQRNMFLEEIKPDQVRIHDSRAQVSHIQRMESKDDWEQPNTPTTASKTPPRLEQQARQAVELKILVLLLSSWLLLTSFCGQNSTTRGIG
ncbi:serine-rich adhesin for platelets-like, partial [Musca vetustissima]|uniref:serine-rich adhesin for platelets-like n=1 Tax=Musca vetustissima TaxID=27455 RepID=UPI002AB608B6